MRTFAQRPKTTQPTASAKASTVSRAHVGQAHDPNSILNLQRTIGNQAVLRLLQSNAEERNAVLAGTELPHFAHDFARIPVGPPKAGALQTKPAISKPGNEYEREADRVAEQVMRMPERQMQGACPCGGGCPKCQTKQPGKVNELLQTNRVQAREAEGIAAPPLGHRVRPSSGQPLDSATRNFFESRFGQDFAHVRVHTDSKAVESASQLGARAYTVGGDIVFGEGMYRPETHGGQRLLTHELAHVVQQRIVQTPTGEMSASRDTDELQAEMAVATLGWGGLGRYYDAVALDLTWHSDTRPLPSMPVLSPAGALIQRVQLTYDDGPDSAGNTRTVLTALNAAGARATFYLVGKRVAQSDNWRIVFDIAAAGHWLGNHAYDWNDATDNHIFLNGTAEERANKILQTEWAIRDALIQGRDDAKKSKSWDTIPPRLHRGRHRARDGAVSHARVQKQAVEQGRDHDPGRDCFGQQRARGHRPAPTCNHRALEMGPRLRGRHRRSRGLALRTHTERHRVRCEGGPEQQRRFDPPPLTTKSHGRGDAGDS